MIGIVISAIGICLAAFGALWPLRTYLTLTKRQAGNLAATRIASEDDMENFAILPVAQFLWSQRKDAWIALPFVVAGIAMQVTGLILTISPED